MKKSLLLLATLCMSSAAFAQWTYPTVQGTPMVEGDTLYLYNKEAKGFLTGANDWGTRASVTTTTGNKIIIQKAYEDEEQTIPLGTFIIEDSVTTGNAKGTINSFSCEAFDGIWIDGKGRNGYDQWVITAVDDGSYTISNKFVTTGNFGVAEFYKGKADTRTYILDSERTYEYTNEQDESVEGPEFTGEFWDKWIFVSKAEYENVIVKFQAVAAAGELRAEIDKYKAEYPTVDYSSVEAVYNNTASTVEELKAAKDNVLQLVKKHLTDILLSATPDDPKDATSYIVNPSFETGDLTGWTCNKKNVNKNEDSSDLRVADNGNGTYHCDNADGNYVFNVWSWGNPITQNVKDIPSGIYKLEAMVASSDDCTNVYITADGGYGEIHHPIELVAPKQTGGTRGSFLFPAKDSILIGAVGPDTDGISYIAGGLWWYKADDFKLTFYGNSAESYQFWSKQYSEELPSYDDETAITTQLRADYDAAKEAFVSSSTAEEILAAYETIKVLADSIPENVQAYKDLFAKIEAWDAAIADKQDLQGKEWEAFADFMAGESSEGYPEITPVDIQDGNYSMTTKEVKEYIAKVEELYAYAVAHSLVEGSDCTDMIINPDFTDASGKGWTFDKFDSVTATNPRGGLSDFYCAEAYAGWDKNAGFLFDVHQELNEVPDGLYSISVNCFYRPGDNGEFTGEEEVPAVIYMNDFQTPVQHIAKEALESIEGEELVCGKKLGETDWASVEGIGYIPNGMNSASQAFSLDMYKQTVYGLVDGGKMRIGIKKETKTSNNRNWCLWTNFKLTYEGKNAAAVKSVLTDLATNMTEYKDANSDNLNDYAVKLSDAAIENATKAVQTNDGDVMWEALISFNKDFTEIRAIVAAMVDYTEAAENLNSAVEEYGDEASAEALKKYNEVSSKSVDALNSTEIKALIEEINKVASMLKVPNTDGASDSNPIDVTRVIVNPSFDTIDDFTGWTGDSFGAGGTKSTCAERYNMNYDTYQDLAGLPAGTYKVTVSAFYRQGSIANDYKAFKEGDKSNYNAYLYALGEGDSCKAPIMSLSAGAVAGSEAPAGGVDVGEDSGLSVPNSMEAFTNWKEAGFYLPTDEFNTVIVKVGENGKLRIGVKKTVKLDTDWSVFDDFTLTYYGANSSKPVSIEGTEVAESDAAPIITTLSGVRVKSLVKGINIVKMGNKTIKVNVK